MKKLMLAAALVIASIFPAKVSAQVAVKPGALIYAGVTGGYSFSNSFIGPVVGFEVPIKRLEFSGKESYDPFASHASLGSGHAEQTSLRTDLWVTGHWSLTGRYDVTSYHTTISKASQYVFAGTAWRKDDHELTFNYFQQFNNGISANGTETDHVKGGSVEFLTRVGCSGAVCFRYFGEVLVGHVLTQGNPVCDGTFGLTGGPNGGPCRRQGTLSGGATVGFAVEFPRHRGYEDIQP